MKLDNRKLSLMGIAIAINMLGSMIALGLQLPIYLDSIGTMIIALALGPVQGMTVGLLTGLVNWFFDPYAIYFAPVGGLLGLLAGYLYRMDLFQGKKLHLGLLVLTLSTSLLGASIAAFVFGGVTSSGSSYLVQLLSKLGVSKVLSTFLTQIFTDYIDRFLSLEIALIVARRLD